MGKGRGEVRGNTRRRKREKERGEGGKRREEKRGREGCDLLLEASEWAK